VIKLTHVRTAAAIPTAFRGPGRLQKSRALLDLRIAGDGPKSSVWKAAKKQLKKESGGKCAYCEGKAEHLVHGDVEHFRPKDIYWWLAYCFDNYTFACQICNQAFKGNKFPRSAGAQLAAPVIPAGPTSAQLDALAATFGVDPLDAAAVGAFDALLASEGGTLPDPYRMDPEPLFKWVADDQAKEVEIAPRDASDAAQVAFLAVKEVLGLNREELMRFRHRWYRIASILCRTVKDPDVDATLRQEAEAELVIMMSVEGEFAGMIRYVVRVIHGIPL
jgi:hypothetical protein